MFNKTEKGLTNWYWFSPEEYFQEKNATEISACIERPRAPVVFLDSFCTYEMIKEKKGKSTDSHRHEYGRLRELITELIKKGKVLSPLCIQEKEIGSPEKQHEIVDSLMDFTNIDFVSPILVQFKLEGYAFLSYLKETEDLHIPFSAVYNSQSMEGSRPNLRVHVSKNKSQAEHYAEEKSKKETVSLLMDLRKRRGNVGYKKQLEAELSGDLQEFDILSNDALLSSDGFSRFIGRYYGTEVLFRSFHHQREKDNSLQVYRQFLQSNLHIVIPYVWCRSVLWAKRLAGRNVIKESDPNDIAWASAYLPFTDYCFADKAFTDLIKRTSLEKQFNTKVFSVKQFDQFLTELENML